MTLDRDFMQRALLLAEASAGLASPNPQVGCVLTQGGEVIGEGAHLYDQRDHAEIVALKAARAAARQVAGATAYVTLEPCSHSGRTGPCADALIAAGIARCVVATTDPNPQVAGRGIAKLKSAGIEVELGLLQPEARRLNDAFAWSITRHRPFVTLKSALSVDGHIAPPPAARTTREPVFLTGPEALSEVQQLRHRSDAILTGVGTVLADDPLLTDRSGLARRRPLMRVILDRQLRTPLDGRLVTSARSSNVGDLWIFTSADAPQDRSRQLRRMGAQVTSISASGAAGITEVLVHLHRAQILSVLVEGGATINGAMLGADLVDRVILYYAERELGPQAVPFASGGPSSFALQERLASVEHRQVGGDVCISGFLHDPWEPSRPTRRAVI